MRRVAEKGGKTVEDKQHITRQMLQSRQQMPLDAKVLMTQRRVRDWYDGHDGMVYVSFSGGKDSTVLRDIVKKMYPDVPAVFCDTGLEYPELREFARAEADEIIKPEMTFKAVIQEYGYPVIGKRQARMIRDLQNESEKTANVCNLHRTGYTKDGRYCPTYKLPDKWAYMVDAPFKVSEKCCDIMKKKPFYKYEKETGRVPFIGTMAWESMLRQSQYLKDGCNAFNAKRPHSTPIAFWVEQDILRYIRQTGLQYASVYGDIIESGGELRLTGEQRTGCMFCMFGVHLESEPNRFQRMQSTHPGLYSYCIEKLGLGEVLEYMGVPYKRSATLFDESEVGL